jgi:uncharacterized protein YkwD
VQPAYLIAKPDIKSPKSGHFASGWIETAAAQGDMSRRHGPASLARWCCALAALLFTLACAPAASAASPAELISSYRLAHGEGKVTTDSALNRIAQEQAKAMAARDVMDHAVLRPFSDRAANLNAERAAENLAADATFAKALAQWIGSYGHRRNLLMHEATRVGIASARSPKSGDTYWAMVIAGPEPKRERSSKGAGAKEKPCELMLNDLCL